MTSLAYFFLIRRIASRAMAWALALGARADEQDDVIVGVQLECAAAERAVAHAELLVGHAVVNHVDPVGGKIEALDDLVRDEVRIADQMADAAGCEDLRLEAAEIPVLRAEQRPDAAQHRMERATIGEPVGVEAVAGAVRSQPGTRSRLKTRSCRSRIGWAMTCRAKETGSSESILRTAWNGFSLGDQSSQ